ncbi:MAG: hypothetical protein RMN51_02255 [Verrucomicrobiota bacterium]|nr:hypothetical protein [Limisphaera sp.]MDW8380918.1 hypothetical protein [Verrucomicrobiota bacterium]
MDKPRLILFYERLMPGTQLVNRLQDLGYQVQIVSAPEELHAATVAWKPLLLVADLESTRGDVCMAISRIRADSATSHVPVLAFHGAQRPELARQAQEAGATLVVQDAALVNYLSQVLNRALELD